LKYVPPVFKKKCVSRMS